MNIDKAIQSAYKYYHSGDLQQAGQICKKILQKRPKNADVLNMIGAICYQLRNFDDAAKYLKKAIKFNPHNSDAYSNLGNVLQEQGHLDEAMICIRKAIELNSTNAEAYNTMGMVLHKQGYLDKAISSYQKALELKPNFAHAYHNLGVAFERKGLHDEAISFFRKNLQFDTRNADACFHLGILLKEQGETDEAICFFQKGLQINPNLASAYNCLGLILGEKRQFDEAFTYFKKAAVLNPNYADAYSNIGKVLQEKGLFDEAINYLIKAIKLDANHALAYNNLGTALQAKGQTDEAVVYFRKALELNPEFSDAYYNLGTVLQDIGKLDEAITCFRKAILLNPRLTEAYNNLGNALSRQGRLEEAVTIFHKAMEITPESILILNDLGIVLNDQGKHSEAAEYYRQAYEKKPDFFEAYSNFLLFMNYSSNTDIQHIFSEHVRLGRLFGQPLIAQNNNYKNDLSPNRRLKIGYVSPDFRQHSVAFFLEPVIREHDHERVEVFCYSNCLFQDDVTNRIRNNADHWRIIARHPDEHIYRLILKDQIDILIDLTGHTGNNRMSLFADKPAPVQISWIGYPATTGIAAIDYKIVDNFTDPPGMTDQFYSEELIRMPESFMCYLPEKNSPDITDLPAISNGYITFGSFNNFAKISSKTFELWTNILHSFPISRLLLKTKSFADEQTRRYAQEKFSETGIDINRIELLPWELSANDHLALYNRIDIALDTFPYNGTTTTCEALWMGVPVITLAGSTHVSRVGVSILSNVSIPELIARTPEEYVAKAVNLAQDREKLQYFRTTLRDRMAESPLTDAKRFTANLEACYRNIWEKWCSS